jgi:hypothetical protein
MGVGFRTDTSKPVAHSFSPDLTKEAGLDFVHFCPLRSTQNWEKKICLIKNDFYQISFSAILSFVFAQTADLFTPMSARRKSSHPAIPCRSLVGMNLVKLGLSS